MTPDEAIGPWEAACLMGVHWSRPAKMAARGEIAARSICGDDSREFAVYSLASCEENYEDYLAKRGVRRRPRTAVDLRPGMVKALSAKKRPRISFGDAIGVEEASRILGVYGTFVPRLVAAGKIVGRVLLSDRASASRIWIISRQSCLQNVAEAEKLQQAGKKRGRPRKASVDQ